MDAGVRMIVEIDTLHELLPELDYYRLLQLDRECPQGEVEQAFRKECRRLHPDRVAALGSDEAKAKATEIYQRLHEAGDSLKDPEKRAQYDGCLAQGILRMTEEALAEAERKRAQASNPEHAARHPKSEKFWKMALRDWSEKNYKGCVLNIQFALNFEPENETFQEWLDKAKGAANEKARKEHNPYKLRIV